MNIVTVAVAISTITNDSLSSDTSSVADEYGNFHRGILIIPDKETVDVIALEEEKEKSLDFQYGRHSMHCYTECLYIGNHH